MSPVPDELTQALGSAYTGFGFNLLAGLLSVEVGKNVLFSPASIATALTMTYNGAAGDTRRDLGNVLGFGSLSLDQVNQTSAALAQSLTRAGSDVQLAIANSLWLNRQFAFLPDFLDRDHRFFGARAETVDFSAPQTQATINQWVSDSTSGKIPTIVDRLNPETAMLLVDAIYFKAAWQKKFDPSKTQPGTFHLPSGGQKQWPLMTQSGSFPYYQGPKVQALSLVYGAGRMSMDLFLPAEGVALVDFLHNVNPTNWNQWLRSFAVADGDVTIPRFKLSYQAQLGPVLAALGMGSALDPKTANFQQMSSTPGLYVGAVAHKAVAEVTEEGTEAAAVTSVGIQPSAMRQPTTRFRFVVDRPFFFAIRDNASGAILFTGVVVEPT